MTNIEWTERVWNPLAGCTPVSPGCANCYAATMAKRLHAMGLAKYARTVDSHGRWTGKINVDDGVLAMPLRRRKPTMWFVNSMSDLFHEAVPFEFVDRVFAVMARTPWHTYQILTKRAHRMRDYFRSNRVALDISWPLPNVWLGTSVENQTCANERIPLLLGCPAAVRFLSCEPLLGPINLSEYINPQSCGIHWVIVGGESGPRARVCDVDWIRWIVAQCRASGAAVFVKQLGAHPVEHDGSRVRLRDPKGGDPCEWPEDLRVREMPELAS